MVTTHRDFNEIRNGKEKLGATDNTEQRKTESPGVGTWALCSVIVPCKAAETGFNAVQPTAKPIPVLMPPAGSSPISLKGSDRRNNDLMTALELASHRVVRTVNDCIPLWRSSAFPAPPLSGS